MGVVKTNEWIETAKSPIDIEEKILKYLGMTDKQFLLKLYQHGMTKFNRFSQIIFSEMKSNNVWLKVDEIFKKYKKCWKGPDIPIFLFPARGSLLAASRKSGVAFQKALFLFIPLVISEKELEVIFVHEYHHVCRLQHFRHLQDSTLLDSVIMEGLAEKAVEEYCGKSFVAPWTRGIEKEEIEKLVEKVYRPNFKVKKLDEQHDWYINGGNGIPKMAGYAIGYYFIDLFQQEKKLNTVQMLKLDSKTFLKI